MLQSRSVNASDVHCDSLIDLLCKHGILQQQNWQKDLDRIKSAFPDALALIPGDWSDTLEIHTTISTQCFWRCEQIFAFLLQKKESKQEAGKSWLGKYKDRLLYKWDLILRTYRRHHVFLAESAVLMVHNSTFEIPGLKKEIKTLESRADFLNRKIEEITSQVGERRITIDLFCKENGITSSAPTMQSIRTDVNRMIRINLPSLLTQIHCTIRKEQIQQGIALYRCFSNFLGFEASPEDGIKQKDELLHTLNTFYYYSGPVVDKAKLSDICLEFESTRENLIQGDEIGSEVDWNVDIDVVNGQDGDGEINWDIDAEVAEAASRTISDGTNHFSEGHVFEADAHLDPEMADLGIDIEIDAEGDLEMGEVDVSDDINASILVEYSLVDPSMREALNNDLLELKCFLDQRCQEMETDEGNMYFTLTRDAPKIMREQTLVTLRVLLQACQTCCDALNGDTVQRLLMFRDSKSALRRIMDQLKSHQKRLEKLNSKVINLKSDLRTLNTDLGKLRPRLDDTIQTTKNIQHLCEEALGVHIVGSINSI